MSDTDKQKTNNTIDEANLMQIIRITIDGVTYDMYSPMLIGVEEEIGQIEALEFGEVVEMKYVVGFLLQYINQSDSKYMQTIQ
jgi:hypothetical protein